MTVSTKSVLGAVVKALDWVPQDELPMVEGYCAECAFGWYYVVADEDSCGGKLLVSFVTKPDHLCTIHEIAVGKFYDWDVAKAAAQADAERRIRSSLTDSSAHPVTEPAIHPMEELGDYGPERLVSKAWVHEGCAIILYGTNDKPIGWINTHAWLKDRVYRDQLLPSPAQEPVAEVVNRFGDPEAFAERELRPLVDIQKMQIGTKLYAFEQPPSASPSRS